MPIPFAFDLDRAVNQAQNLLRSAAEASHRLAEVATLLDATPGAPTVTLDEHAVELTSLDPQLPGIRRVLIQGRTAEQLADAAQALAETSPRQRSLTVAIKDVQTHHTLPPFSRIRQMFGGGPDTSHITAGYLFLQEELRPTPGSISHAVQQAVTALAAIEQTAVPNAATPGIMPQATLPVAATTITDTFLPIVELLRAADSPDGHDITPETIRELIEKPLRKRVQLTTRPLAEKQVDALIAGYDLEILEQATEEKIRIQPLRDAGITTITEVLRRGPAALTQLPGIGTTTAQRISGAAQRVSEQTRSSVRLTVSLDDEDVPAARAVIAALYPIVQARRAGAVNDAACLLLIDLAATVSRQGWRLGSPLVIGAAAADADRVRGLIDALTASTPRTVVDQAQAWADFAADPASYLTVLASITGHREDGTGDLPQELAEAIARTPLNLERLHASLRGYQYFGTQFAVAQQRTLIGDEMGLGKTMQAIALLCHLVEENNLTHALVICPAPVVTNWVRELTKHSTLTATALHGSRRSAAIEQWLAHGGIGVATFEGLRDNPQLQAETVPLGALIVDEAHYAKNPEARRSKAIAAVAAHTPYVLFLTGTPLENRVEEFLALLSLLQPDLVQELSPAVMSVPTSFRTAIAPAYLRRNQEQVLDELPQLIEATEIIEMAAPERSAYEEAVAAGNWMAMRQAPLTGAPQSEKLAELLSIVDEAGDNGQKVIVFSYFRSALSTIAQALGPRAIGPLTGSIPAPQRQELVDAFTAAPDNAVLVSQIVAGGIGMNIQAATVVVLVEPQLKPSTESQAIARAHRMGQTRRVTVYRLITADSIDERIVEILETKRRVFDDVAKDSALAGQAATAVDITDTATVKELIAAEQERLGFTVTAGSEQEALGELVGSAEAEAHAEAP